VLSFDRRGHGRSERTPGQGSMAGEAEDLAALIEALDLAPAHIAGVSWGGSIVLRLASRRPELFLSLIVHEPPLFGLVVDDAECRAALGELESILGAVVEQLSTGDAEGGARRYVEQVAYQPGAWAKLPKGVRRTYLESAQSYLDQCLSPDQWSVDLAALSDFPHPALLTQGDQRAPLFGRILDVVAATVAEPQRRTLPGTAHAPQLTHPGRWVGATLAFTAKANTASLR
jgi:pimeloyl-ACP methyl ester carboxylesterase